MLDFLYYNILAVDQNQNVPSTKLHSVCPAFNRTVELMAWRTDDFLVVNKNVHQFVCFSDIGFYNLFQCNVSGCFIPGPDVIARLDFFNRFFTIFYLYKRSCYKTGP